MYSCLESFVFKDFGVIASSFFGSEMFNLMLIFFILNKWSLFLYELGESHTIIYEDSALTIPQSAPNALSTAFGTSSRQDWRYKSRALP